MDFHEINSNTKGKITKRQTTYVKVALSGGNEYKIHYIKKEEYQLNQDEFTGISVLTDHPMLIGYKDSWSTIHISTPCDNPQLIKDIKNKIIVYTKGWRQPEEYLNQDYNWIKLIEDGFGLLFSGPFMLGKMLTEILEKYKIKYTFKETRNHNNPKTKVLILGQNVVVAKDFKYEKC